MNEVDISTFNNKFTQYEGTNVRGAQVKALVQQVVTNNISNSEDASRKVKINNADVTSASSVKIGNNAISTGKTYTVTTSTGPTGLVNNIIISEK